MRLLCVIVLTGLFVAISGASLLAGEVMQPPLYDEAILKADFEAFMDSLDSLSVSKNYPGAVEKLLSCNPEKQMQALKTLAETVEIETIPWMLPFLDAENPCLRVSAGSSLEKLVSSYVLKRADPARPETNLIRPLRLGEKDLRPLAWIVLKMFRKSDDGILQGYATTMARYLGLYEFKRELEQCLESRHPAVANGAKWALESLEEQKKYEEERSEEKRSEEPIEGRR